MSVKSPLALMKEKFNDKKSLVEAVQKIASDDLWLGRTNSSKGLAHVSNAKLLKLHATFTAVKERFGTRAKLIESLIESEKRTKDAGYKTRLETFPVPRLWDMLKSAEKRAKAAVTGGEKTAKKSTKEGGAPAAKKAPAKKAAAAAKKPVVKKSPAAAKSAAIKKSK